MPTPSQMAAMRLYADLMEEAKSRLAHIDFALSGATALPIPFVREFCFLQLRMLCELVALGCLTAHGDITRTTKLRKEWAADEIMKRLEQLHPPFYPWPVRQTTKGRHHTLTVVHSGFLSKSDLIALNGKCGAALHRGDMRTLLSPKTTPLTTMDDVLTPRRKFSALLDQHCITLADEKSVMVCFLQNMDDANRVQVVWSETITPPLSSS